MTSTNNVTKTITDDRSVIVHHSFVQVSEFDSVSTYIPTGAEFINLPPDEQMRYEIISFALFSSEPDFLNE